MAARSRSRAAAAYSRPGTCRTSTRPFLLPLTLIIAALSALNLEHVVFSLMSGIAPEQRSSADLSYGIVFLLSLLSVFAAPVLVVWYGVLVFLARSRAP